MSDRTQSSGRTGSIVPWNALETWRAGAFLVAGTFFIGFVIRNGIIAFGDGFSESATAALYLAFVVPAEVAAYVGLLGLYPRLSVVAPRLAAVGAALAGIAAVAVVGFAGGVGASLLAAGPPEPPAVSQLLWLVTLATTISAFVVFGVAGLRTEVPSRTVGVVLLLPPATYVVMMTGMFAGYAPEWSTFALSPIQAAAHVGIGLAIRNSDAQADRVEASLDSAA